MAQPFLFPLPSTHIHHNPKPTFSTHPHILFFPGINVHTRRLHREPFCMLTFSSAQRYQPSDLLFSTVLTVPSVFSLFLSASLSLYVHLLCLISLHSLLLPLHFCTSPLTHPPHHPLALIHSINHSPHSCFFTSSNSGLYLPTEHVLEIPCLVLPLCLV